MENRGPKVSSWRSRRWTLFPPPSFPFFLPPCNNCFAIERSKCVVSNVKYDTRKQSPFRSKRTYFIYINKDERYFENACFLDLHSNTELDHEMFEILIFVIWHFFFFFLFDNINNNNFSCSLVPFYAAVYCPCSSFVVLASLVSRNSRTTCTYLALRI